jgi:hypothetical protein
MNKIQLTIAWIMGIFISLIALYSKWHTTGYRGHIFEYGPFIKFGLPVMIIGGLLIYTLRTNADNSVKNKAILANIKRRVKWIVISILLLSGLIVIAAAIIRFWQSTYERSHLSTGQTKEMEKMWNSIKAEELKD